MKLKRLGFILLGFLVIGSFVGYRLYSNGYYERWKLERTMTADYRYKDYVERGEELNAIVSKVQNWELNLVDKSVNGGNFNMRSKADIPSLGVFKDVKDVKNAPKDLKVDVTYYYDINNHRALQHIRVNSDEKALHKNTTVVYDKDGMELITYD